MFAVSEADVSPHRVSKPAAVAELIEKAAKELRLAAQ
jgi:hypothetical protein